MDLREYADRNVEASEAQYIYENSNNVYFIVKSWSDTNIRIALERNTWATTQKNEEVFDEEYGKGSNVVLIFSINGSSQYIGYALMKSRPGKGTVTESIFQFTEGVPFKGNQFDISWVRVIDLPFSECADLKNKFNDNLPIKVGRDGQKIDKDAGQELCKRFEKKFQQRYYNVKGQGCNKFNPLLVPNFPLLQPQQMKAMQPFLGVPMPYYPLPGISGINPYQTQDLQGRPFTPAAEEDLQSQSSFALDDAVMSAEYNPAISIFPVDLTNMSYDQYRSLYDVSHRFWSTRLEVEVKKEED